MNSKLPASIFNDVIAPVMRLPSSSNCAAALRSGRLARVLMEGRFTGLLRDLGVQIRIETVDAAVLGLMPGIPSPAETTGTANCWHNSSAMCARTCQRRRWPS